MRPAPAPGGIAGAARTLAAARRPLILAGGGARQTSGPAAALAGRLGAPLVMTTNARGLLPPDHPLAVPASPSLEAVRALIRESDAVLALGTEFGRTDYDMYDRSPVEIPGRLIRIEIDPEQMRRGRAPDFPLIGDAAEGARLLAEALPAGAPDRSGPARAAAARDGALAEIGAAYMASIGFLERIRDTLPAAPLVGDSTQAVYAGNLCYAAPAPGLWFNASTGYGALGYGLPAAIGAARATGAPVVCLVGDGGLQFSLADLGTAIEERLPVIVLVWNNRGYGEIKSYMLGRRIAPVGVDLHTPDFVGIARAYGMAAERMETLAALPRLLTEAAARQGPTLIEFDEGVVVGR